MDFKLPKQAYLHKFIPKNKFFDKTKVNTQLKKEFSDQIQKITWEYKIAPNTVGISETEKVEEIQIFEVQLKEKIIPKNVLRIIDKTIPYPILYVFKYESHFAYGISLKEGNFQRYYFSEWDEIKEFNFFGINLERVYQGLVESFISIRQKGKDFDTIVQTDKMIETLEKEIKVLQNKVKNEKQFNRKVELNMVLLGKKNSLIKILKIN
jgi:hypothetical protein